MRNFILCTVFLFILSGCATTHQYMIPHKSDGTLTSKPKSNVLISICANCNMWPGAEISPIKYQSVAELDGLSIEVMSSYRYFNWLFLIPLPLWMNGSSTVRSPDPHIVYIRLKNLSTTKYTLLNGSVSASKNGRAIPVFLKEQFPDEIQPGETIIRAVDIGDWNGLGRGYNLDLSGIIGPTIEPIQIEQFTSTVLGIMFLD